MLSGTVPNRFFHLETLQFVDLGDNQLEGKFQIPTSAYLRDLRIGENRFTGTIPTWIGYLRHLTNLSMYPAAEAPHPTQFL
jgi:hypothetical protein